MTVFRIRTESKQSFQSQLMKFGRDDCSRRAVPAPVAGRSAATASRLGDFTGCLQIYDNFLSIPARLKT